MSKQQFTFDNLDAVVERVNRLHEVGYDRKGNWSLGQNCNHLTAVMELTQRIERFRAGRLITAVGIPVFLRLTFLGRFGAMLGLRLPTLPFARQSAAIDDTDGIARLKTAIDNQRAVGTRASTNMHLWHSAHHLGFLVAKTDVTIPSPAQPRTLGASA